MMSKKGPVALSAATIRIAVVLALVVGVGILAYLSVERDALDRISKGTAQINPPAREPHSDPKLFRANPSLLVITDSLGVITDDVEGKLFHSEIEERTGWHVVADAVGARGYVLTDLNKVGINRVVQPAIKSLKFDADNYKADFIIVDMGRNDLGKDPEIVKPAVHEYLTQLRGYYPRASIVVVIPAPMESAPKVIGTYPALAPAIRDEAQRIGAHVFDPLAEGWYRNVDLVSMQVSDKVHLNSAGHEFYAQKVVDNLQRIGLYRPSQ